MKILSLFSCFAKDDQAAVTVDWVVLTSAIIFLGVLVVSVVSSSLNSNAAAVSDGIVTAVSAALS